MIEAHDESKGPFFLYGAYQAVHGPLEAPQKYLDQCGHVTEDMRHIFCGMVLALDDGIGNITRALKAAGLLDNVRTV
jgi:arylsulfatase B/arylsulfatase I/J